MKKSDQINNEALTENINGKYKEKNRDKNFRSRLNKPFEESLEKNKILRGVLVTAIVGVAGIYIALVMFGAYWYYQG